MRYTSVETIESLLAEQTKVADGVYTSTGADEVVTFNKSIERFRITAVTTAIAIKVNGGTAIIRIPTTSPWQPDADFAVKSITLIGATGQKFSIEGFSPDLH